MLLLHGQPCPAKSVRQRFLIDCFEMAMAVIHVDIIGNLPDVIA